MSTVTPSAATIPYSGAEAASQATTQDNNNAARIPHVLPLSFNTSLPVEPDYAPIYPLPQIPARTALAVANGVDTVDPTAVPVWIGKVAQSYASGTTLHVVPYGNYGAPPASSQNYYVATQGATTVDTTTATAQSGGAGSDYSLTISALGHAHSVGDYVVAVAAAGTNTTGGGSGSVPVGAVGGPGTDWVDFYAALTYGSAAAQATIMPRLQPAGAIDAHFADTSLTQLTISAAGTQRTVIRVETHGQWCYPAVTQFSGTGATLIVYAVVN